MLVLPLKFWFLLIQRLSDREKGKAYASGVSIAVAIAVASAVVGESIASKDRWVSDGTDDVGQFIVGGDGSSENAGEGEDGESDKAGGLHFGCRKGVDY